MGHFKGNVWGSKTQLQIYWAVLWWWGVTGRGVEQLISRKNSNSQRLCHQRRN